MLFSINYGIRIYFTTPGGVANVVLHVYKSTHRRVNNIIIDLRFVEKVFGYFRYFDNVVSNLQPRLKRGGKTGAVLSQSDNHTCCFPLKYDIMI